MANGGLRKSLATATRKRYWREADAKLVVRAWRSSGQDLSRFAAEHGISVSRLSRWAARLGARRRGGLNPRLIRRRSASALKLRFHPVELIGGEGARSDAIEVVLVDGRRVRVPARFAAEDLDRVLEVLDGRSRC